MVFIGALATGNVPAWMLRFVPLNRDGTPVVALPQDGQTTPAQRSDRGRVRDADCSAVGREPGASAYSFQSPCAGRSIAPNGRWGVEMIERTGAVRLAGRDGLTIDDIASLADGRAFVLEWSPSSDWFFVNHSMGRGEERLRLFQIVNGSVVERSALFAEASREMVSRYPCLGRRGELRVSGRRWSADGTRVALVAYAPADACLLRRGAGDFAVEGEWQPLWMIGEVESGRIDPDSVRASAGGIAELPSDGPYAAF
ncbi:hypothetical protein [Allosphingosinicella sp.]|uniref:hypothetical protein n=1 Tax=Allosphingosinicella sp. TaxID=2823234 RepID=UPI003D7096EF